MHRTSRITACNAIAVLLALGSIPFAPAEQTHSAPNDLYSIEADEVVVDAANEVTTYRGNATVTVANLIIEADSIALFGLPGIPSKIAAVGSPISFREQVPKQNINGTAREIVFVLAELKLTLSDYSIVDPAGNRMTGKKASFLLSP
jgi:lipopolysaccharide transport protein LptA